VISNEHYKDSEQFIIPGNTDSKVNTVHYMTERYVQGVGHQFRGQFTYRIDNYDVSVDDWRRKLYE
jgi:hypothetical protein